MAMGYTKYPARSRIRENCSGWFEFETNSTSDPDALVDLGGVVSTVTHTSGANTYVVTLHERWAYVKAIARTDEDDNDVLQCVCVAGGSAANTITLHHLDGDDGTDVTDDNNSTVTVFYQLAMD